MYRNNFDLGDDYMDITLIFKVAGVGILISVLNMILGKVDRSDWATLTTLAGVVIVLEIGRASCRERV